MTSLTQRQHLVTLIEQAAACGARLHNACHVIGISCRTFQRWLRGNDVTPVASGALAVPTAEAPQATTEAAPPARAVDAPPADIAVVGQDRRQAGLRRAVTPTNKLTPIERDAVMTIINSAEFKDLPPSQIVPRLADQGLYVASESTMQRLLREQAQHTHRRSERPPKKRHKPFALKATAIHQIYSWDITYLPTAVKGQYYYLYVFVDVFSRYIVGAQVFAEESAELAAQLLKDIAQRHGLPPGQVTLHSDNGSPMKGQTMLAMMQELGVIASRSRPSVSNDNPYSESLFHTIKHRPLMPVRPFESLEVARRWAIGLVDWYNREHRHSAISFVTPQQRHLGQDEQLLMCRRRVYAHARAAHPQRWSKNTRQWVRVPEVHLNPDKSTTSKEIAATKNQS